MPATEPNILLILGKGDKQKGILQSLQNGFGPVQVLHNPALAELRETVARVRPKLLLCDVHTSTATVQLVSSLVSELNLPGKIIAVAPSISTRQVIKAMSQGARDLVSEEDPLHLQLVIARELGILQSWCEQNSGRLAPFRDDDEGHATLEGIRIVSCDPVFAGLVGVASAKALENASLLQYVNGDDHHRLKQLINRSLQGESTANPVRLRALRPDGKQKDLLISLKTAYQDDRALQMLTLRTVMPDSDTRATRPAVAEPDVPLNLAVTKRIQNALKQNQLALAVQPISELVGEIARQPSSKLDIYVMIKDSEGELSASKFIREARASGLIRYIDRWVIHNACVELSRNLRKKGPVLLFLRLSPQTLHDPTLLYTLKREVQELNLPAACLSFELFESDAADLNDGEIKILRDIKEAGFLISISRFGSNQGSLDLLQRLPMDFIKLDPKLTEKVQHSESTRKFFQDLIQAANTGGIGVVSTHVSNATVMAVLWQLGIHYVQGNYLQEPEIIMQGQD